jgi:transposase
MASVVEHILGHNESCYCPRCGSRMNRAQGYRFWCQCGLEMVVAQQGRAGGEYVQVFIGELKPSACPRCGHKLIQHRCQLWCEQCGMVESCEE